MARQLALFVVLVLAFAACRGADEPRGTPVAAQDAAATDTGPGSAGEGITVTGHGTVTGEPDTLRATVGVHVTRADVDQAFSDASAAADRVLEAVREQGVDDRDIQTREFSVRPQRERGPDATPSITGYTVRNLVQVTIREVDRAGDLLTAVADAGGDDVRVEGLRFSIEDDEDQLATARQAAFDDARRKAEHYAELAGRSLGALLDLEELPGQHRPPPIPVPEAADTAAAPIEPGQQEIGVTLRATWSLQ